jgi:uncharacterized protein
MRKHFKKLTYLSVTAFVFYASAGSYDDFFQAVRLDDAGTVRELLKRGFDPNTRDAQNQTGLLLAAREPSPKVALALVEFAQTDVEARNAKDESPLMLAALKGQQDLVARLIQRDADVNKPGWAPLHYAATTGQVAIMQLLLENYAFIDAQSPNGTTPLMMAAMYGSTAAVKLLLDEGADPMMKNALGLSALDFARRASRPDAIELLTAAERAKPRRDGKW